MIFPGIWGVYSAFGCVLEHSEPELAVEADLGFVIESDLGLAIEAGLIFCFFS